MRNAFARTLYELACEDESIIVLVADISPAGAMEDFRREFPARFINVGVAEQAMIGLAAGLAQRGFRPFCYTIATFALLRPCEFIRCDLAYQDLPVTVVGMGAGLSYSTLGGTHQAIEDVAVAMACPSMTVLVPCDPGETAECVRWCASRVTGGPVYMRIGKAGEPYLEAVASHGVLPGRIKWLRDSTPRADRLVVSYGPIAREARRVARQIGADMLTIAALRPLPARLVGIVCAYSEVIVIEEASGGPLARELGGCVGKTRIVDFSLPREFPHAYGPRAELLARAGLTAEVILAQL